MSGNAEVGCESHTSSSWVAVAATRSVTMAIVIVITPIKRSQKQYVFCSAGGCAAKSLCAAMKIYFTLLALCAFKPNTRVATAFSVEAAPKRASTLRKASSIGTQEPSMVSEKAAEVSEKAASSGPRETSVASKKATGVISVALKNANFAEKAAPSGPKATGSATRTDRQLIKNIWDTSSPAIIQGRSLHTWSFESPYDETVQVCLKTAGRPLRADVDLWQGPDNTPQKIGILL